MKSKFNPFHRLQPALAFLTFAALGMAATAQADTYTWDGANENWGTAHWTGAGSTWVNSNSNDAIINGGGPVFAGSNGGSGGSGSVTANSITVSNATLRPTSNNVFWNSVGTITLNAGGVLVGGWNATNHISSLIVLNGGDIGGNDNGGDASTYGIYNFENTIHVTDNSTISVTGAGATLSQTGGTQFNVDSGKTLSVTGTLVQNGYQANTGLIKNGDGTMVLSNINTYTGGTTVNTGTLELGTGGGAGIIRGTLNINSGGTVKLTGTDALGYNGGASVTQVNINGGTLEAATTGNNGLYANSSLTGGTVSGTGRMDFSSGYGITTLASGTSSVFSAPMMLRDGNNMTITVADGAAATDLLFSGAIIEQFSGSGITKSGDGTLALTNTNSYTGNTTVNAGTLSLGNGTNNTNLSDAATVSITAGATVNLNFTGSDTIGKLIIDGETLSGGTYNSSTPIYGSYFTGTGSLIVLDQSGTWTSTTSGNWGDSNNWLNNVIAVGYDKTATFSAGTGSESITVTLDTPREIGNLQFSNANYNLAGTSNLTLNSVSVPVISVASGASATVGANLAGSIGLEKTGPGTLTLDGVKTYTGGTTVTGGTLVLATGGAVGPIRGTLDIINPGTTVTLNAVDALGYNNTSDSVTQINIDGGTLDNAVAGNNSARASWTLTGGTMTSSGGGAFNINYNSSGGNTITTNPSAVSSVISAPIRLRDLSVTAIYVAEGAAATDLLISGAIGDVSGNSCGIAKNDAGKLVLSGANTYTGNTTVNEGILELASTSQLQFVVTEAPASNMVTGAGTAAFNGSFNIDTAGVSGTTGHIWLLVDRANLTGESFGSTFSVTGFTQQLDGLTWTMTDAKGDWSFSEDTGELTLDIGSDYDAWKTANGVTGGENDDDDNDGLTNHEEYAFGLDPTGGSSVNPIAVQLNKTTGTFSYTRRLQSLTDLTYTVWTSVDLATWTEDNGATTSQTVTGTVGEVETVQATIPGTLPLTAPKLFIQVRAN
jgi:fibronectin-binding autotransporter adhesin